jgi:DNA polymerase alpha subunit A
MTCLAGRLLVDTYVCGRDLLKEVEYSLASLARKLLQQERPELQGNQARALLRHSQAPPSTSMHRSEIC